MVHKILKFLFSFMMILLTSPAFAAGNDNSEAGPEILSNVTAAYYQVWLGPAEVGVAEASYDNLGRHARKVEGSYQVGKAFKFDLLRARVEHENLKPAIIMA